MEQESASEEAGRSPEPTLPASAREGSTQPLWAVLLTPLSVLLGATLIAVVLWIRLEGESSPAALPEGGFTAAPASPTPPAGTSPATRSLLDAFLGYARELDLNVEAFRQCLADRSKGEVINAQYQRGVQLGVTGTPTFFINNKKVVGAQPAAVFDEVIEAELRGSPQSLEAYSATIQALARNGRFAIVDSRPDVADAHFEGSRSAKVVVAEFSDFQCPFCKQWVERYLPSLRRRLGDEVALAYLHFPIQQIHPNAPYASLASICAGDQGRFWEMHDLLFARQQEWASLPVD